MSTVAACGRRMRIKPVARYGPIQGPGPWYKDRGDPCVASIRARFSPLKLARFVVSIHVVDGGYAATSDIVIEHIERYYGKDITISRMVR